MKASELLASLDKRELELISHELSRRGWFQRGKPSGEMECYCRAIDQLTRVECGQLQITAVAGSTRSVQIILSSGYAFVFQVIEQSSARLSAVRWPGGEVWDVASVANREDEVGSKRPHGYVDFLRSYSQSGCLSYPLQYALHSPGLNAEMRSFSWPDVPLSPDTGRPEPLTQDFYWQIDRIRMGDRDAAQRLLPEIAKRGLLYHQEMLIAWICLHGPVEDFSGKVWGDVAPAWSYQLVRAYPEVFASTREIAIALIGLFELEEILRRKGELELFERQRVSFDEIRASLGRPNEEE